MSIADAMTRLEQVAASVNDSTSYAALTRGIDKVYVEITKREAQHQEELAAMRAANNDHRVMIRAARVEAYDRGYHDGYEHGWQANEPVSLGV